MRKKSKPFKIDLGLGNLYGDYPVRKIREPVVRTPTYAGEQYAVYTQRDGVTIKHTFKKSNKAKAFLETARASGAYDSVSNIALDF